VTVEPSAESHVLEEAIRSESAQRASEPVRVLGFQVAGQQLTELLIGHRLAPFRFGRQEQALPTLALDDLREHIGKAIAQSIAGQR